MLFSDLVTAVLAFAAATVTGWGIYRVQRWQEYRFIDHTDQALDVANSGRLL